MNDLMNDGQHQKRIVALITQGLNITLALSALLFVIIFIITGGFSTLTLFVIAAILPEIIGFFTLRRGWVNETTLFLSIYFILLMVLGSFAISFIPPLVFGVMIISVAFVGIAVGRGSMQVFIVFSFVVWVLLNALAFGEQIEYAHVHDNRWQLFTVHVFAFCIVMLIIYKLIDVLNESIQDITMQKTNLSEAITQLQQSTISSNFLNDIFESLSDMLIVLDEDMRITRVNRLVTETTGFEEVRLIGNHIDIIFPDERIMLRPTGAREMTETREIISNLETICLTIDGNTIPVSFKYSPIYDDHNRFKGIICTAQNLSEITSVRQELEISNRRYLLALSASQGGVVEWNVTENELYIDPNLKQYLGYSERTLPSTIAAVRELMEPEDIRRIRKIISTIDDSQTIFEHEFRMRHRDGNMVWFLARGRVIYTPNGKVETIIAALINITLRQSIEQELRDSKERLHDLLETLPDMILHVDVKGLILEFISPTSFALSEDENYVNRRIYDMLPFDIASHVMDYVRQTIAGNKPEFYEYQLEEDGQINSYEARFTDFGYEEVIVIIRQVNERKRFEDERVQVQVKEERTRLLSDFVQSTSHDFRTTLNVVTNGVFLLKRAAENGTFDDDKTLERLLVMEEQAYRLARLLESLFVMLRLDTTDHLEFSVTPINPLVKDIAARNKSLAERHGVTLHVNYAQNDPYVAIDELELGQALMNLVNNAIIYNQPDGSVTITVEDSRDKLIFRVQDSGNGIPEDHLQAIFKQLHKVDSSRNISDGGGLGLGLPIAMRVVELHHGKLNVESTVGQGSTFTITLFKNYLIPEPQHS